MSKAPACVIWDREMEVRGIPTKESRESRELLKGSQGKGCLWLSRGRVLKEMHVGPTYDQPGPHTHNHLQLHLVSYFRLVRLLLRAQS